MWPSPKCDIMNRNPELVDIDSNFNYVFTMMYGRYSRSLGEYARQQAAELREAEKNRKKEEKQRSKELRTYRGKWTSRFLRVISFIWRHTFAKIGEDWVFLALLGIIVAMFSYIMDYGIVMCNNARVWMYRDLTTNPFLQYLAWICLPVFLVLFSAGFVHILAPQAIGSGIPEMKTILRGVVLKEYLTFRTGVAKVVALTAALGSGMPLGKEGPLVHIASIVATLMSKMVTSFKGIYENESRNSEMLAAACAVGVSCNFGAPIGGVLFSIEVTSVYFAIRNYWRGFFSAVFGALMFRLMAYWFSNEDTLTAIFGTDYHVDFPYDPQELFIYALVGAFGGLCGAAFILFHRRYVLFMRKNKRISSFLQKNRFIYPGLMSLLITTLHFPLGLGQFLASTLSTRTQILHLFSNFTWVSDDLTVEQAEIVSHWVTDSCSIFVNLSLYMLVTFFTTIWASTLPVPSGTVIPIFKMGAAFGRMIGEAMHLWFPEGVRIGGALSPILPGGYAIVGAAAFSAGLTHSISICVVISEMTGQIRHIIPVMIAVLVANAISTLLQPSLYDSIIMIKKLPYLPDIISSSSAAYSIFVEDFMVRNIKFIYNGMSYKELKNHIRESRRVRAFPLVDNPDSMILLGSIQRTELIGLIERHIGRDRRLQIAAKRQKEARVRMYEDAMTTLQLDPPPFSRVSLALPAPPAGPSAEDASKKPVARRPSRFEVVKAPEMLHSVDDQPQEQSPGSDPMTPSSVQSGDIEDRAYLGSRPQKSILKRTNSQTLKFAGPMATPSLTPYSTVTGAEGSKFRAAIGAFIRKSSTMLDSSKFDFTGMGGSGSSLPTSPTSFKKVTLPRERVIDMTPEEQKQWEDSEMMQPVDFHKSHVDPAPFQLVERTSLLKVHSMFSLLGVNHAYVTTTGKLMGIVSLKELRKAIEDVNSGIVPTSHNLPAHPIHHGRDVSPGAPIDVEHGPEPPGFDDSDSDSDDTDYVVGPGNSIAVQPSSATLSSIVPDDSASENGSTGIYITSHSREDENSIKLRVTGAGSCSDESDDGAAKGTDETERKS
ncbi:chloride channel protein 2-like isoform X1 [Daphnia pulex]|uniref:chloride channel protein 2-like isoform X1 n=1 Tax=Daphnia pulex TaxID=6669 RepID=UPI001EDDCAFD|nr:chloride channel protein 2-like isoform X1 [Daphnia pulex]